MRPWRTRSRRTLLERSPWLTVESHAVELPDGEVIEDWPWIVGREFVNVFAETKEGSFLVFRQVKYAVEGTSLAPVGGYLDDGEEPLAAARRELLEETGHAAADWTPLGRYVVDGNRGAGVGHLYLARGARKVAVPDTDDLEEQELLVLSRAEVEAALVAGEFKVMSWATVVALALVAIDLAVARDGQASD
jgi:8-oxo-dGTP pyrophosphatase MutT (NUDIX family)